MNKLRIVFLGTPQFAVPTLAALIAHPAMHVAAVVSQPDKPIGRNQEMHVPPTKELALAHNIPVFQPLSLAKSTDTVTALESLAPDVIVMVAFGQILKQPILRLPRLGVINLHGSLLPAYRGAAPINWAIINGDTISGATTMFTEAGVDTGPILLKHTIPIGPDINAQEFGQQMSIAGASLVIETLEKLLESSLVPIKQDDSKATYAPILTKELGLINWSQPAASVHNLVRGLIPWPGAFTHFRGKPLKIWKTKTKMLDESLAQGHEVDNMPGAILIKGKSVIIKCGADAQEELELLVIQPVNRARMAVSDWINGAHIVSGERLGC